MYPKNELKLYYLDCKITRKVNCCVKSNYTIYLFNSKILVATLWPSIGGLLPMPIDAIHATRTLDLTHFSIFFVQW